MADRPLLDHRPELKITIPLGGPGGGQPHADGRPASLAAGATCSTPSVPRSIRQGRAGRSSRHPCPKYCGTMGGEANVKKIVDDFCKIVGQDPKVDITRGGKVPLGEKELAGLKQKMVEWISISSSGPLFYSGRGMKELHRNMGITDAQFDAFVLDFRKAMEKYGVKAADAAEIVKAMEAQRREIVEAKQPGTGEPFPPLAQQRPQAQAAQ